MLCTGIIRQSVGLNIFILISIFVFKKTFSVSAFRQENYIYSTVYLDADFFVFSKGFHLFVSHIVRKKISLLEILVRFNRSANCLIESRQV